MAQCCLRNQNSPEHAICWDMHHELHTTYTHTYRLDVRHMWDCCESYCIANVLANFFEGVDTGGLGDVQLSTSQVRVGCGSLDLYIANSW